MSSLRIGRGRKIAFFIAAFFLLIGASNSWAEIGTGYWDSWWLPPVRSVHGVAIDSLFRWIYWITMVAFVGVEGVLLYFLIKYRSRPDRKKAFYTHGNTRLEMAWTIVPAIILAILAFGSKKVWDNYRYSPTEDDPNRAKLLLIGEQFKWNIIYPGPDGKFGRYLMYPKPTDAKWPIGEDGKDVTFADVPGPASLNYDAAIKAINQYIATVNKLGKDYSDPAGADDDYKEALGRELVIPAHRPIEVQLSSKDVIHDFFLPNFRVKLDAVPGMRGELNFTATMTSAERRAISGIRTLKLDQIESMIGKAEIKNLMIVINDSSPGADQKNKDATGWRYFDPKTRKKTSVIRDGSGFSDAIQIAKLREIGLTEVNVVDTGAWELVCEELCGQGHNTMTAPLIVLSNEEYDAHHWDKPWPGPMPMPVASAAK